jgi:methylenetetrahydrofolate reductase (NADPH)
MKISCEFFPPKTPEGADKLIGHAKVLGTLHPEYFSVTFGAGGSTQQGTLDTVLQLRDLGFEAAPHLSCVGQTRASLREIILRYQASGISRIVALRGDLPSGAGSFAIFAMPTN